MSKRALPGLLLSYPQGFGGMKTKSINIVTMPISELTPAPYNPRKISDSALQGLRHSIKRFGMVQPVIWNKRTKHVVGGHQRIKAILAEGKKETEVVVVDLPESEEKALNVALNSPYISGEFTDDVEGLLAEISRELPEDFASLQLDKLLAEVSAGIENKEIEEDEVPEAPEKPITRRGDLIGLGDHVLFCGDSTDASVLELLLKVRPKMVWSDPPYGLGGYAGRSGAFEAVIGDNASDAKLKEFFGIGISEEVYVCCEFKTYKHLIEARGVPRSLIVWAKNVFGMGSGYRRQHEFIGYYGKFKGTTESDLWELSKDTNYQHPTQKPVNLPARAIQNSTNKGDVVFDPFGGSGSTLMACEQLGRKCVTIEIEPKYCDVIVSRWEKLTSKKAVRHEAVEA